MRRLCFCVVVLMLCGSPAFGQATFHPLPAEYAGATFEARGISADGNVIVGSSINSPDALRWTLSGGFEVLGAGIPFAASADGSSVVGGGYNGGPQAFLWTEAGGMVSFPFCLGSNCGSYASDVSGDGSAVVGSIGGLSFRWSAITGMVDLGNLSPQPNTSSSAASAVSADGLTVIGTSESQAYRWSQGGGMAGLGYLPGTTSSVAADASADGSVIVGSYLLGEVPFRWTENLGMVALDTPCLACGGRAYAVSGDGSVTVGWSESAFSGPSGFPFIWDEVRGMQDVGQILVSHGIDLTGWSLGAAIGVSSDGFTILGAGQNPSGNPNYWVASIPPPSAVPASNAVSKGLLALLLLAAGLPRLRAHVGTCHPIPTRT